MIETTTNKTTNAKIKVIFVDESTAVDSVVICAFCGRPKCNCTCRNTATVY